ncbi:MAG: hypothetical protein UU40_C0001G0025 [Candidatus Uhrbacteria bacterium GW2011_GWD2_41_121]|uniref:IrrE N-terminal-like domain-containing protein n=1 Tax=Candidatus Uhrbacteria bacterium GW2011_GWC1_41_20 TaxID=1618983 RepID=A0A0G0VK36_9BACT|nr:MAG: hypothetical protein UT52_C0001G0045 [Candidatus Uhrbacteria bacterium GW2011_GWE1_39_46]KKR64433.1 MAG: hypothetical protein UU04_C0002G0045 [Candidatus Uhrbacteria bacterium GW2011_GWC2_40_450]KKR90688.1 MAG: hypothetical protein UU40_C0001G0025 [Candidatus Uhrbacteria bacterium GW2011_GWD2_41_121]KKR96595.1 MAG: hypothetical protein UU46_C0001G0045 [Candidatus Uhrbacteria bacterium GW2011_GWD1_41_16]KKR99986.1 MAG: hypothetical protein UU50_C0001G0045 [Candidatus Uhrbacteria bacteriu
MNKKFQGLRAMDRSRAMESDEEREDRIVHERLKKTHEQIVSQLECAPGAMQFFQQHESDFLHSFKLGDILMKYDLLACGPILPGYFEDVPLTGDLDASVAKLEALGQEEINARWQKFLKQARRLREEARAAGMSDTASWIIGHDTSPYPTPLDPDAKKPDPIILETSIPSDLKVLALFMTQEKVGKQIQSESVEQWLSNDREPTEIDDDVNQKEIERIFGEKGPNTLYDLLPEELHGIISKIKLVGPRKSQRITAHGEEHQIQFHGGFDKDDATMILIISPEQNIQTILETWFHELGHAMITRSTEVDRDIRKRFAQAVAISDHLQSGYASGIYDTEGIERGLEEDFAESIRQFFIYPREFEQEEPKRFNALKLIFRQYVKGFSIPEMQRRLSVFMEKIKTRKAA